MFLQTDAYYFFIDLTIVSVSIYQSIDLSPINKYTQNFIRN